MSNSAPSPPPPSPPTSSLPETSAATTPSSAEAPPPTSDSPTSVPEAKDALDEIKCDLVSKSSCSGSNLIQHQPLTFNTSGECAWALRYPEIQKACYLRRVCQFSAPKELRMQNVASILQVGPTCGLTALSMFFEGSPSTKTFLEKATRLGYSNNGEMFSAQQLNDLLAAALEDNRHLVEYKPVSHALLTGWMDKPDVKAQLQQGSMFLVPYDPDRNHTPCLEKGHKAHWALIIGYLIDQFDDYYVFARHGKTKNLALWSLRDLAHSNANLVEFCQPTGHSDQVFVLPEGGIGGRNGLRCQFIMIERYKAREEIVM